MAQERGAEGSDGEKPEAAGGDVPEPPMLRPGNDLVGDGRYRLTHRLGRGGMAEVYAAEDVRLGRAVAVKLLRSDLAEDPVSKARFTREAQSVAGLNHHAVVAVYDSGEETMGGNTVPYIVMELVNGRTIRDLLIDAEAPPAEQALVIVSGVLEALAYSHHHGIVHRDIKPANVIITDTGTVKVMDFGIARALHGAAQTMTQTGMVMGTPQYLSPEQALGKAIDIRSDLYAVGCLLFELLTLRPPFVGETPLAVVYQHVQDQPRLPSELSAAAPPELDGLVMRSLAKDPDDRFQSAEEMRGLVQYALRMLQEHGSHTGGLWNTGSVTGGTTPPMGTAAPAAGARGATTPTGAYPGPSLAGADRTDDHAADPGAGDPRRGGRLLLLAVLAVIAIGIGVLVAAALGDDGSGAPPTDGQTTTRSETDAPTTPSEEDSQTEEEDEGAEQESEAPPRGQEDDYPEPSSEEPSESESAEPTDEETTDPTEPTTTPPTDEETGGEDTGTTDEGAEDAGGTTEDTGTTDQGAEDASGGGEDTGTTDPGGAGTPGGGGADEAGATDTGTDTGDGNVSADVG